MKSKLRHPATIVILGLALLMFLVAAAPDSTSQKAHFVHNQVIVPGEDRFTPFSQTIHAGDAVRWINMDTDDHTVVSDDAFTTAGNRGVNILLKGTDNNGGQPGTLVLHFNHPGTFVYYCRFHAHLDESSQPVAPGPEGGIQDPDGNHGTPMMGVITVLAKGD
ncbi:MAG: plastocyanin/azurin family copper-binding protein [Thermoanaerobaculia bacterium]